MNRALNEALGGGRLKVHNHAQITLASGSNTLPNLPANEADIRRVVLRPKADITMTLDGSDPEAATAMYAMKDEIVVLDTDGYSVRLAGAGADVRLIYLGA